MQTFPLDVVLIFPDLSPLLPNLLNNNYIVRNPSQLFEGEVAVNSLLFNVRYIQTGYGEHWWLEI